MNDPGTLPLKEMIQQALEKCNDITLLDLIYKLIIYETDQPAADKI